MKKVILVLSISLLIFSCKTQQNTAKKNEKKEITAVKNERGDLVGSADRTSFMEEPYNTWFNTGYDGYKVDLETAKEIKEHIKGVTVKGFMGTWCGDSKRETPHFYKIADEVGFDGNIDLVTVNRSKKTPENLQEGYNIIRVPTFIFYRDGKEIGRFVEYPRDTLEKDILKIVSGQDYKHSYER